MPHGQNVSLISFDGDQNELCIVRFNWKAADDNEKISVVESTSSGPNDQVGLITVNGIII